MKKFLCILLACFMLASVPVHGYAVSIPTTFGIGVEVILPFLLSLLGVQSKNEISTYLELESYHDEVYNELVDGLAGIVGANVIENWLIRAASGIIDTDSVVWQKLKELAISNYSVVTSSNDVEVNYSGELGNISFSFLDVPSMKFQSSRYYTIVGSDGFIRNNGVYLRVSKTGTAYYGTYHNDGTLSSERFDNLGSTFTYNGLTAYFSTYSTAATPEYDLYNYNFNSNELGKIAWLMLYGGYSAPSENFAAVSDSFSDVLTSSQKDDIVDGTSVIQLYNPSALQNGLEIIPGGDPYEDPNLRKIPFAITADWWNLLEQFGDDAVNQSVAAYNALNNLDDGTSTGTISRAWESLGLGSVVGSAQNAQEGIINLTDENIFPRSSTVQQTVTDTIPSALTPEAPDSGIDNESEQGLYKLPDLRELFPFCIPFDLIDLLSKFVAEPETPQFAIALSTGFSTSTEEVDLHVVDSVASIVRTFELIGFVLALILITRNLIRG